MSWSIKEGQLQAGGPLGFLMKDLRTAYVNSHAAEAGETEGHWYATFAFQTREWALETWNKGGMLARRKAKQLEALPLNPKVGEHEMAHVFAILDFVADNVDIDTKKRMVREYRERLGG
jgi:hypothetical protein